MANETGDKLNAAYLAFLGRMAHLKSRQREVLDAFSKRLSERKIGKIKHAMNSYAKRDT